MKDRDFLIWIHERLELVHGENPHVDYMHKLRAIIFRTPLEQLTPNSAPFNNLDELRMALAGKDAFNESIKP
jgi:hypothetical protein